jgi:hypothetical protein
VRLSVRVASSRYRPGGVAALTLTVSSTVREPERPEIEPEFVWNEMPTGTEVCDSESEN